MARVDPQINPYDREWEHKMSWARIMTPLSGGAGDAAVLQSAATVARLFDAELVGVYTPADIADLMPWMGEGFMGGVQISAVESLREATIEGEARAKAAMASVDYGHKAQVTVASPVWAGLSIEGRLSDVIVFDDSAARGRGPLAESFQQLVADEQRPVIVARPGLTGRGTMAIAWDGGKEATRAVRTALPLLEKASRVVILAIPSAAPRPYEPKRLQDFLAARGVTAEVKTLTEHGDVGPILMGAAKAEGAELLVAGAFGHPRLQEFIFGGATRSFLQADGPSLFLSH